MAVNAMWQNGGIDHLLRRWGEGGSLVQIARELGVSKSACAGMVRRLREKGHDLPQRPAFGQTYWSDEQDQTLKRMKADKATNKEIAEAVGKSEQAVWGRCNRLGITQQSVEAGNGDHGALEQVRRQRRRNRPKPPPINGARKEVPIFSRSGPSPYKTCQFIEGEPSADDSCKCGAPTVPGVPYCEEHAPKCYTKNEDWRDRAISPSIKEPKMWW